MSARFLLAVAIIASVAGKSWGQVMPASGDYVGLRLAGSRRKRHAGLPHRPGPAVVGSAAATSRAPATPSRPHRPSDPRFRQPAQQARADMAGI